MLRGGRQSGMLGRLGEPVENRSNATGTLALAIVMDGGLAAAKLVSFSVTGSASMLSEGLHSLADVSNQLLLAVGIHASRRAPDPDHPYGYGRARPFWALLSASGVLFIGAGATLWNGVQRLFDPEPLVALEWAIGILLLGFASEAVSITVALRGVRREAREDGVSIREAMRRSADPVLVAIVSEDTAGLIGASSALAGVLLSHALGDPLYDAIGAIGVGVVMAVAAIFLIDRNRQLLLDVAIPASRREALTRLIADSPLVQSVRDVKATALDADTARFKAEVEFDGRAIADEWLETHDGPNLGRLADEEAARAFLRDFAVHVVHRVGREIDAIEADIRRVDRSMRHIDLEVDGDPMASVAPDCDERER